MNKKNIQLVWLLAAWGTLAAADEPLQFNRDIRPILAENCFACHGPDREARKAELRLDKRDEALAKQALVPGKPEQSSLIERIFSDDPDLQMPPPDSRKKLTDQQQEQLKRWIAAGAEYQLHWAYLPPVESDLPHVQDPSEPIRNPIDAFVQARLAFEGLSPSPAAAKETLIRRVTLDLIGLPPTPAEVDAFLQDTSHDAYEKVVDRLLASPHYGECLAIDWLDAARYADSNGYQVDRDRELWHWRNWVIRALNDDMPFDQFTIEQLAGDLLPNATLEQRIATGFHRNHMMNEEGGIIPEEFLAEYTADRVETTAAIWLGQTFNCSRCHDHKFDPFTQRDFYALKAFFHNVPESGVGNYGSPIRQNAPPFLKLPAPEVEAKIAGLNGKLAATNEQLAELTRRSNAGLNDWVTRLASEEVKWEPTEILAASGGDPPTKIDAATSSVEIGSLAKRANTIKIQVKLSAQRTTALRFECSAVGAESKVQWSDLKVESTPPLKMKAIAAADSIAADESAKLLDKQPKTQITLAVKPDHAAYAVFVLESPLVPESPLEINIELGIESASGASRWRLWATGSEPEQLVPTNILAIAKQDAAARLAADTKQLDEFRLSQQPDFRRLGDESDKLKKQISAAEGEIPTTLVMEEMEKPRATFILVRGAYDKPGEAVAPATPATLPALDEDLPRNRLGLAKWLVSSNNPLTARVTVNRIWQKFFGIGLVRTSEDFGTQGEPPSHPELLDWLAVTFRETGWDVKRLVRLIVTSTTYRQQSQLTPGLRERDPENRLLARGPRHRLMAELVRDQALAASGLLVQRLGGPSVKPYHPPGLYEQVTAGSGTNVYVTGKGKDLHRRSLYTYWKRSVPHPAMLLFDAPFRETCTLRRPRSNTPLQALNLMNDATYVESARFLARRMMLEGGESVTARITWGIRLVLAREPRTQELAVLSAAYDRVHADLQNDESGAKSLLSVGEAKAGQELAPIELATFTVIASTILNLDEAVTKE